MNETKFLGSVRSAELAELRRYEDAVIQRPFSRLRVWHGAEDSKSAVTGVSAVASARSDGRYEIVLDLGRHLWIYRVRFTFDAAPGKYELSYCCDLSGVLGTGLSIADSSWVRIAAGQAFSEPRLVAGLANSNLPESVRGDAHVQPALFGRFVRVVCDAAVTALAWSVVPDKFTDVSHLIDGSTGLKWGDSGEFYEGLFSRPELTVTLRDSAEIDLDELLGDYARVTLERGYLGENFEQPSGFEGSGYWPKFTGYIRRAELRESVDEGGRWDITARSGRREVEGQCSLPMVERKPVGEYLRDIVTVDAESGERICGVAEELPVGKGTHRLEYVGATREFGNNWFGPVVGVDANEERVYGVCWTGTTFAGVVLRRQQETEDFNSDFSRWYLVRWDAAGREVERKELARRISSAAVFDPGALCVRRVFGDIALAGDTLLIAEAHRSLKLSEQRYGYGSSGLLEVPAGDWSSLGDVGTVATNAEGVVPGARWRALSVELGYGRIPAFVVSRPDGGLAVGVLRNDRSPARELVDIEFWSAGGSLENVAEGVPLDRYRVGTYVCGSSDRFWIALTGASWIGHQGSDPGLQADWVDRAGYDFAAGTEKGFGVQWLECSFDGAEWRVGLGADAHSDYLYAGLCTAGDVFAFGFGESGGQELARVGQFEYRLECGSLLSQSAGDVVVNYPEPVVEIDGEVRSAGEVSIDRSSGKVSLLRPFGDGFEIRASYDYLPTVDLVPIVDRVRWEVLSECCFAHGLHVRIDEVGRIVWGVREVEEVWVYTGDTSEWVLGRSILPDGLAGIVADSISVTEATEEELVYAAGEAMQEIVAVDRVSRGRRWTGYVLRVQGEPGLAYRIRFRVQEYVADLGRLSRSRRSLRESSRVVTRVSVRAPRRLPSGLAQRMETLLRIGPRGYAINVLTGQAGWTSERKLEMQFSRILPARVESSEWRPKEKVFERTVADDGLAGVHLTFDDPILCSGVRVFVFEGGFPQLAGLGSVAITGSTFKFRKIVLTTPAAHSGYGVWLSDKATFRVCDEKDFRDMTASNMVGGAGNLPARASEIKTVEHFYLKKMNLLSSACSVLAVQGEWVEYRTDSEGRLERGASLSARATDVIVRLRPEDSRGVPLVRESPYFQKNLTGTTNFSDAQCAVTSVVVLPEGVRIGVETESRVENRLGVEIVGHPVAAAEMISVVRADGARERLYGKQEKSFENDFVQDYERAERIAAGVLRRGSGGRSATSASRMSSFVRSGDVAYFTDKNGVRTLKEIRSVSTVENLSGRETVVEVG